MDQIEFGLTTTRIAGGLAAVGVGECVGEAAVTGEPSLTMKPLEHPANDIWP